MNINLFEKYTNRYQVTKTLRFELVPKGKTLEHIQVKGLLEQDELRAKHFVIAKNLIDSFHKSFINNALEDFRLEQLDAYEYLFLIDKKNEEQKETFEAIEQNLRKQIAHRFSKHPDEKLDEQFKSLFTKDLFKIHLPAFVKTEEEHDIIEGFSKFTSYFTTFNKKRAKLYSSDINNTAICFRLIHQNLPKFIANKFIFERIINSPIKDRLDKLLEEFESVMPITNLSSYFELDGFNKTLTQIGIDTYNYIIGGFFTEDGKKIKGLNEYINQYNQQCTNQSDRITILKPLYKQLLSDQSKINFFSKTFSSDIEALETLNSFYKSIEGLIDDEALLLKTLYKLNNIDSYKVFIKNDQSLSDLSIQLFGHWGTLKKAIIKRFEDAYHGKKTTKKFETEQEKYFKDHDSFSIGFLNECLAINKEKEYDDIDISQHIIKNINKIETKIIPDIRDNFKSLEKIYSTYQKDSSLKLSTDQKSIACIKELLEGLKVIQAHIKVILGSGKETEREIVFYNALESYWDELEPLNVLYNQFRTYLTKKPYSTEKIKLNFDNSLLLSGWDENRIEANTSILFIKDEQYYLGILDKKYNKLFREIPASSSDKYYNKVNYKLLPGANKLLPKICFSEKHKLLFNPSEKIIAIRNHSTHTKNGQAQEGYQKESFHLDDCHEMIDYFKACINKYSEWAVYNFNFSDTKSYNSIDEFYNEIENQAYSITYTRIDEAYMNTLVDEGKIYLFKLHNKDFSSFSKGTPNMHTLYWKTLFDERNLKNVIYKLNGNAEIFYRKKSINEKNIIVHKANEKIKNKRLGNEEQTSLFKYDIIKDKRYTVDKFLFNATLTINYKAKSSYNINPEILESIRNNEFKHIIAINRDTDHLLYVTILDLQGNLKEQFSLNEIVSVKDNKTHSTNYLNLLRAKEIEQKEQEKNWQLSNSISNIKEGYLSQAIHQICSLILKYNALVTLEDPNIMIGTDASLDKNVYKTFVKLLIEKLSCYIDKKNDPTAIGGVLRPLHLTNKFESITKLYKQNGIIFFVFAGQTKLIDPTTGFINFFNVKYESVEKTKKFIDLFDAIRYNTAKDYFELVFDYNNFTYKTKELNKTQWCICSYGKRIALEKEEGKQLRSTEIDLTEAFKDLFEKFSIDYKQNNKDLKALLLEQEDKGFFSTFIKLFSLMVKMQNQSLNKKISYFISPVENKNGAFFNTVVKKETLPENLCSNGAYHLGKKALLYIDKINNAEDIKKIKLSIDHTDWLNSLLID
jgi:CRISPR-associated protein Cpf1